MASIQKIERANGRSYRVMWREPGSNKQRSKNFAKERDARTFKAKIENDMHRGAYQDPNLGHTLFRDYANTWLQSKVNNRRTKTGKAYTSLLQRHILPTFGNMPLSAIQQADVQEWYNAKAASAELSPSTLNTAYGIVASIFKRALNGRYVAHTPCVDIDKRKPERKEVRPLTADQVNMLAACIPDRYRAMVLTAAGTGMRLGEVTGLTVDRIDFLRRTVRIDRQLVGATRNGEPRFGPPKTEASNRTVPLPQAVAEALSKHLASYGKGTDGLIFTNDQGNPIVKTSWYYVWGKAVAAAGLPEGTRFHDLRHTFASWQIAQGTNPKAIQKALGHASITETFDTYGHLMPESDDAVRSAIDAAFASSQDHVADSLRQQAV